MNRQNGPAKFSTPYRLQRCFPMEVALIFTRDFKQRSNRPAFSSCSVKSHSCHRKSKGKARQLPNRTLPPLSLEALRSAASKLPANIYRAKGVVYSCDAPDRRAVLQVVGKRVDISLQDEWGERPRLTQIVAIGSAHGLDAGALQDRFEQCLSAPAIPVG